MVKNPSERRTIAGLLREIGRLPLEQTRAALETSAAIAGVSLRASIEFLRQAPDVAQVLEPPELRAWGELGRRLTMGDVENGVSFFTAGVGDFHKRTTDRAALCLPGLCAADGSVGGDRGGNISQRASARGEIDGRRNA